MRYTKPRVEILTFLQTHHLTYTAYEIAEALRIHPVTVYRVLEFFKSQKMIHHISSLGRWCACFYQEENHEDHGFLICRKCKSIQEFLSPHQCHSHADFHCEEHRIEILGTCHSCQ
jgi:Fe2+ or Zn2+ uptake regulation protein